jgi:hypothetical protein
MAGQQGLRVAAEHVTAERAERARPRESGGPSAEVDAASPFTDLFGYR